MSINLKDVSFKYETQLIIKEITSNFDSGEIVSLVGPNGAGKTTFLKLIAGTLNPDAGHVYIYNQPLDKLTSKQKATFTSFVPQNPRLPEEMRISDFVMLGRNPHLGMLQWESKPDFEIAHNAMSLTEIEHICQRKLGEVSGGEKQRAILALALTQQSPIMLLDEPTSNLDISHQTKVMNIIKNIHSQTSKNRVTIFAIHDLNIAGRFSDRVILFSNGEIVADGSPAEVLTKKHIESVYQSEVAIGTHPTDGSPLIIS